MKKVAIILGSASDLPVVQKTIDRLKGWNVPYEAHVFSAHRTPDELADFTKNAKGNGFGVIIAAAGKAAALPGAISAITTLPVIGLPIKSSFMDGLDSLLSIAQMPPGVPVATVGIDAADNAAILAVQMLAIEDDTASALISSHKEAIRLKTIADDNKLDV